MRREAPLAVELLFDTVVAQDVLPHVLRRWGPIPGVRETRDLSGAWDAPGSTRTVVLEDGNAAREEVLVWERPERFVYRVSALSGFFGRRFDHAIGAWTFTGDGGRSAFAWTYTFHDASPLLRAAVPVAWARYMATCADRCVTRAVNASG